MIKRSMKKWYPEPFSMVQESVREATHFDPESNRIENMECHIWDMLDLSCNRMGMKKPKLLGFTFYEEELDHERMDDHYVMVIFLENDARLDIFEPDGITPRCGTQSGEGKFLAFESKYPYEIKGNRGSYVILTFKEAE